MALVLLAAAEQQCSGVNYPQVALRMEIWRDNTGSGVDAVGNKESLRGKLMLVRRGTGGSSTYNANNNCSASASANGSSLASVSGLGYDFRTSSGMGGVGATKMLWEGNFTVAHNADGTKTLAYSGAWGAPSGDILGSTSVSGSVTLPRISQAPGTPTGLTASWVSDTQTSLAWVNHYPSNGVPTTSNVQSSVNGAAFASVAMLAATQSASISTEANRKTAYRVNAQNATGASAWSASATVYTTPAAPTAVSAAKDPAGDILVGWSSHVAFAEHEHVVEHSTDGGSSWSALAIVAGGTSSYTHASPSTSVPHSYRLRARNTDTGALASAWVVSNTVVLLTAPSKPTIPTQGAYQDRSAAFVFTWVHNAIDTTAQTAFESAYSTDGGSTWTSTGKTASTDSARSYPASTWSANQQVAFRVRTWGQASAGGSEGTGASPWSDPVTVAFKSRPATTILSPVDGGVHDSAALTVQLSFTQPEGASFVSATIELYAGATLVEQRISTTLAATLMAARVANGASYVLRATVRDSNGLVSAVETSTFSVAYTEPVAASVTVDYLEESGIGQLGLAIPEPGAGEVAAAAVTITRTIDGVTETVVEGYPAAAALTILDTTPTIHGVNVYVVTTISADGATTEVERTLTTAEPWRAFLSTGAGYARIVSFGGDLTFTTTPSRSTALVQAAGRRRPIAMFGEQLGLEVSGSTTLVPELGSTAREIEQFLLEAGTVCYRDASGRRMFGIVAGSLDTPNSLSSAFQFTVTEATS